MNAFVERFVLSIKRERVERKIFFGAASLERAIREYVMHYQGERSHQGVGNAMIEPEPPARWRQGWSTVTCAWEGC